ADLAAEADHGLVVARRDGLDNNGLRQLAQETLRVVGDGIVVLAGAAGGKSAIAVAVSKSAVERGASADAIARPAAQQLGGGVGKGKELVAGGGPNVDAIDAALSTARDLAVEWRS